MLLLSLHHHYSKEWSAANFEASKMHVYTAERGGGLVQVMGKAGEKLLVRRCRLTSG